MIKDLISKERSKIESEGKNIAIWPKTNNKINTMLLDKIEELPNNVLNNVVDIELINYIEGFPNIHEIFLETNSDTGYGIAIMYAHESPIHLDIEHFFWIIGDNEETLVEGEWETVKDYILKLDYAVDKSV